MSEQLPGVSAEALLVDVLRRAFPDAEASDVRDVSEVVAGIAAEVAAGEEVTGVQAARLATLIGVRLGGGNLPATTQDELWDKPIPGASSAGAERQQEGQRLPVELDFS